MTYRLCAALSAEMSLESEKGEIKTLMRKLTKITFQELSSHSGLLYLMLKLHEKTPTTYRIYQNSINTND